MAVDARIRKIDGSMILKPAQEHEKLVSANHVHVCMGMEAAVSAHVRYALLPQLCLCICMLRVRVHTQVHRAEGLPSEQDGSSPDVFCALSAGPCKCVRWA